MNKEYRVYYRTNATAHYIDLGKRPVELAGNEARIELNGQLTKCVVEDVERPASDTPGALSRLYVRRK
jgi:hypothetical protein